MTLSAALWLALLTASCCGNTGSREEESTTEYYDKSTGTPTQTPTPDYDYDYNVTFDYYFVTGFYQTESRNKAVVIGQLSLVLLLGLAVHHIWN